MKILITGHTGFKGSWLTLLLNKMGYEVSGLSLDPSPESHFSLSGITKFVREDYRVDIRDKTALFASLKESQPQFIFHLAAQSLVKESFRKPEYTYDVNVNGTLNILEMSQKLPSVKGILIVTSDKVYANASEEKKAFSEDDPLGFSDPYSTSKAMADLLSQSWSENSKEQVIGIARAGNVIGGGDFGVDRLIPDLFRHAREQTSALVRYPKAVRPWQYVLDCLYGYVLQMHFILEGHRGVFNFGPGSGQYFEVEKVANGFLELLGRGSWMLDKRQNYGESDFLTLDSGKAASILKWSNRYNFQNSLKLTAGWYFDYLEGKDLTKSSQSQVEDFLAN
jgi:CDP-glucose 4,6-dehydratase